MKKTMASLGFGRRSDDEYYIEIEDAHSSCRIAEIKMTGKEVALLLTGLHGIKAEMKIYEDAHIAMKKEVETVSINLDFRIDKKETKNSVDDDFEKRYKKDGWQIWSYGTSTQQNVAGKHQYVICRYHPVEDPLNVERYY